MAVLAYNAINTRKYTGRIERNTRKLEEDIRHISKQLEPVAGFFTMLLEEAMADPDRHAAALSAKTNLSARLRQQKEIGYRLKKEGMMPEQQENIDEG